MWRVTVPEIYVLAPKLPEYDLQLGSFLKEKYCPMN